MYILRSFPIWSKIHFRGKETQASSLHRAISTPYFDKTGRTNAMQAGSLCYVHPMISSETKISLLFDGFFFRYFSLQKSLSRIKYGTGCSIGYVRFL